MEKKIFKFLTRLTGWVQMLAGAYLLTCAAGVSVRLFGNGRSLAGGLMAAVAAGCAMLLVESIKEYRANLRREEKARQEKEEEEL